MTDLKKPVSRRANRPLDTFWGPDRNKRIVVTITPGNGADVDDLIELRPERTRRTERIAVTDVYRYALACRVNCERLKKGRDTQAKNRERDAERARKREIRKVNRGRLAT